MVQTLTVKWTVQRTLYDEMKGRLRDGKPKNVIDADGSHHCIARLRTCANGAVAFNRLLPGDYTLFAWRISKAIPFSDPLYPAECAIAIAASRFRQTVRK
jgi:hypothetical protein